jgi:O-methyltransferase involved in polyketide biosynthesis
MNEVPKCRLTRVGLDLANDEERRSFLSKYCAGAKSVLVITEGVIPYLTEEEVAKLADDLRGQAAIDYWIAEYFNAEVYRHLKANLRTQKMQNAPFRFYPPDWLEFFEKLGWTKKDIRYSGEVAVMKGRSMPMPWWGKIILPFLPKKVKLKAMRMTGYLVFQKKK